MDTIGRHLVIDLWDCDPELLKKIGTVQKSMVDAALEGDADIREVIFHQFEPDGVSGVVVISESHLTIHTFPEHAYASVDVYTCGNMDPHVSMRVVAERLKAGSYEMVEVIRGQRPMKVESRTPLIVEQVMS